MDHKIVLSTSVSKVKKDPSHSTLLRFYCSLTGRVPPVWWSTCSFLLDFRSVAMEMRRGVGVERGAASSPQTGVDTL